MSSSSSISSKSEKALLIGVYTSKRDVPVQRASLDELERLAETAGATIVASHLEELRAISPATYLGKGKVQQLAQEVLDKKIDVLILDEDLSPTQNRNLEEALGVKVIDRTGIILDIFARRARTREGKIQVELAQMKYLLPRMVGHGGEMSQLGGGIGTRGPGETRLELDRRRARDRVAFLEKEAEKVKTHRDVQRARRAELPIVTVSLVGYTNAGKSTLMRQLTQAAVLVEDKLFATLDPTVRRLKLPSGREVLLSDTVGFVRKLPHALVKAFRATFEEVAASDLLLHVIDASHPQAVDQAKTVEKVLEELELHKKPVLRVLNKMDALGEQDSFMVPEKGDCVVSALRGSGMPELLQSIDKTLAISHHWLSLMLPHDAGGDLSLLYRTCRILKREDRAKGIYVEAEVAEKYYNKFKKYGCHPSS